MSFGSAAYTVAEGSSRTVTVSLDADPERTVVIPIEAANEGGASDSDYTGVPESVTFDAGDISKSFDLSAVEDNLAESGERVKLSFGTLPADASAGTPSEASVSIHDRTQGQDLPTSPTVHFESAAYSVDEGATVAVKVKLSKAPGSEAVIPISITNRPGPPTTTTPGFPTPSPSERRTPRKPSHLRPPTTRSTTTARRSNSPSALSPAASPQPRERPLRRWLPSPTTTSPRR